MLCWGDEMQQSTGFHVGSFLSWQVAELLLAFQHGGEGTVCVCVSLGFISCLEIILATLWECATV